MTALKEWAKDNSTLLYFLVAQFLAIATAGLTFTAYMVKLETRTAIMETRGAEYTVARMEEMKLKIAKLEQAIENNESSIRRIVDIMTRELGKREPQQQQRQ